MSTSNRINNYLIISSLIALTIAFVGCGPQTAKQKFISDECAPTNLTVTPNNGSLHLKWDTDCPKETLISGYNIYLETKPIDEKYLNDFPPKKIKPFNHSVYPGDTDPENSYETMDITNLDNGVEYYVSVRTVFPDKSITVSSNQVGVMPRPEGSFELAFRYAEANDGFSFNLGEPVRADAEANDIYFYSKDGFDFIASPNRLNGFLRTSKLYSLGKTEDIYQYPTLELDYEPVDKIPVIVGESYLVKTADNHYAKIRIDGARGEGKQRVLEISYIYQTLANTMRF